jgi:hypothetical protein
VHERSVGYYLVVDFKVRALYGDFTILAEVDLAEEIVQRARDNTPLVESLGVTGNCVRFARSRLPEGRTSSECLTIDNSAWVWGNLAF